MSNAELLESFVRWSSARKGAAFVPWAPWSWDLPLALAAMSSGQH